MKKFFTVMAFAVTTAVAQAAETPAEERHKQDMVQFLPEYYLAKYDDLAKAFKGDQKMAFQHYRETGIKEGRSPNPFFDPIFYRQNYPDLRAMDYVAVLQHWAANGAKEGRAGTKFFNIVFYVEHHGDLKMAYGTNYAEAWQHWRCIGSRELRRTSADGLLALAVQPNGNDTARLIVREATEGSDPDLFRPDRTTGGQIGFAGGLVVGTVYGVPEAAIPAMVVGHGLDRLSTRVCNDITGPAWKRIEKGPLGQAAGDLGRDISDLNPFKKK